MTKLGIRIKLTATCQWATKELQADFTISKALGTIDSTSTPTKNTTPKTLRVNQVIFN